jgi:hypothetical protein
MEGIVGWFLKDAAGFFTFVMAILALGQIVLFLVQLRLIRESLDDAKSAADAALQSAEAARLNAQAVIDAERPHVFIVIEDESITRLITEASLMEGGGIGGLVVKFHLKNYGRTPALIGRLRYLLVKQPRSPEDDPPNFMFLDDELPVEPIIADRSRTVQSKPNSVVPRLSVRERTRSGSTATSAMATFFSEQLRDTSCGNTARTAFASSTNLKPPKRSSEIRPVGGAYAMSGNSPLTGTPRLFTRSGCGNEFPSNQME